MPEDRTKKILITGGCGFIGQHLANSLNRAGEVVDVLDDYSTGNVEHKDILYINDDITEINWLDPTRYKLVFHLAALSRIQPSFQNPTETYRVNTTGTMAVLEWAKQGNIPVIYAGSSSRHHDPERSPYAMTKYLGEQLCKLYRVSYGMHVDIARFYNVYGHGEIIWGDWAAVIGRWRGKIHEGQPLPIVGDGEQRRDFTHVDDIVDGLVRISQHPKPHADAWELGTGVNYSINELFEMFKQRFPNIKKTHIPDQPGNYRFTLNTDWDAYRKLDWRPHDKLKSYIQNLPDHV